MFSVHVWVRRARQPSELQGLQDGDPQGWGGTRGISKSTCLGLERTQPPDRKGIGCLTEAPHRAIKNAETNIPALGKKPRLAQRYHFLGLQWYRACEMKSPCLPKVSGAQKWISGKEIS